MIPKLFQWLFGVGAFLSVWLAVVLEYVGIQSSSSFKSLFILPLPLIVLVLFAIYSLGVIIYRVAIFNNCEEASEELKTQIEEAKADLQKKGFKFDNT
ncbi:dolichol-phosphate mannosyltransferase subunit 3-like [Mytilus californianus]|uniref:dolichol-phosphate mannosyltransferase subunit 3-like n=1 Tax=Mytilus californianus TaxID=6549 RepID=UPI0022454A13|nr:dolichol-phosphate mannosyltransferase subunit 3-like [Mytilus californianus]XP_052072655.1 dolichol-phosphate mannosyltransferase subunit 3-like [Mytilus californianus]XP_052072665.1 dolichol-phosphate mannosyltransferase subunit 3-like [Mytilus californianus]XP_052072673.1 dolichol-phosphate mannosyltransferase subunit 3-like [Mytilus californianus]XP_052072681.1 dolichol-phosphate mannosyltransferase subunit 3-like [Mytilus californianus]XP_052072686.1 dolichol-phosphate mannosyltransfer